MTLATEEQALAVLRRSPRLPVRVAEMQHFLADEADARARFYETMTEGQKVEYINGEVVVHSPVKLEHNRVGKLLLRLLDTYVDAHRLGYVGYEKMMVSLTRNDYEPDICFWGRDQADAFEPGQMRFPAPDFVAEVLSPSTEAIDRGVKLEDYAAHGVAEYWILDPVRELVEQYGLEDERYVLRLKVHDGPLASLAVPGFSVPVRALFDEQENLAALAALLGGPGGAALA